jgi:hypothetical protein
VLVVALLAGATTHARAATPKPSAAAQLNAYLKAMSKPATALAKADNFADTANYFYTQWSDNQFADEAGTDWSDFASEVQRAHDTAVPGAVLVGKVKPPAAMEGPHALLAAQSAAFVKNEQAVANKAGSLDASGWASDPSSEPVKLTVNLGYDALKAQKNLHQAAANWRQELIVQLRRAQITVPLWLKQVGA